MSADKKPSYLDTVEAMRRFEKLRPEAEKNKRLDALREILPQGHLSGLNADMLDGLHAEDFLRDIREAMARARRSGAAGGGGGLTYRQVLSVGYMNV